MGCKVWVGGVRVKEGEAGWGDGWKGVVLEDGHCCMFFFSSRRRHTRYIGDWSSDVCSSDLGIREVSITYLPGADDRDVVAQAVKLRQLGGAPIPDRKSVV